MIEPAFTDAERLALAGFLAGYRGLTREAHALDLRQFTTWCRARSLNLFAVRRADIESFARDLEARGRARTTVTRRLCTIAGFYIAVHQGSLAPKPGTLTFEQAAAVPLAAVTALQGMRAGGIRPGQHVLIIGASGGAGTFAVQIARHLGATVTGVCSTRHADLVRRLGAEQVIDYTKQDVTTGAASYDLAL
jgi:hypothetical protein